MLFKMFTSMNTDKSGSISKEEMTAQMEKLKAEKPEGESKYGEGKCGDGK